MPRRKHPASLTVPKEVQLIYEELLKKVKGIATDPGSKNADVISAFRAVSTIANPKEQADEMPKNEGELLKELCAELKALGPEMVFGMIETLWPGTMVFTSVKKDDASVTTT